jgi:hypothetical protein
MPKAYRARYKLHSARKLLIYKELKLCFFFVHFNQSLAAQGFGEVQEKI